MNLRAATDVFWPTLEGWNSTDLSANRHENLDDLHAIANTSWAACPELALEEARRLAAAEDARRQSAEGKASTYLLMIAGLIALLTYLENAIWDSKFGTAPKVVTLPILALGVAYIAWAGLWAFRTVTVGNFYRVGEMDLVRIWKRGDGQLLPIITVEILTTARRNRETVNAKVSALRMAHEFMVRGFFSFALVVVIAASWGVWHEIYPPLTPTSSAAPGSPSPSTKVLG